MVRSGEVNQSKALQLGTLALAALGGGVLLYCALRAVGPLPAYGTQPPAESGRDDPDPSGVVMAAHEHLQGVKFIQHRYPDRCGMQVTSVMHHGYAGIRIPESDDSRWLVSPPSEVAF
jgi:hypothetical protein